MVTAATAEPAFDIGRVVNRAIGVIGRNALPFFLISLICNLPYILMLGVAGTIPGGAQTLFANPGAALGTIGLLFAAAIGWLVGAFVLQAALTYGTVADLNGKRASFGDSIMTGLSEFAPLLGLALLSALGIIGGYILLIVPGVMLAVAWSVIVPVRIVERLPILDCFGRSATLTRGHRWSVFGLMIIYFLASAAISFGLGLIVGAAGAAGGAGTNTISLIAESLGRLIASVILSVGTASIYYELRSNKEGIGPEQLAAVFD
jgi:hypothetical protein